MESNTITNTVNVIWIFIQYDSAQSTYQNIPIYENQNKIIQQVENRHLDI